MVGAALVVRTEADEPGPLARLAVSLPAEPDRVPVLLAAAVCARPDVFDLLPDLLGEHLGGCGDGVRLIPLGRYPIGAAEVVAAAGEVADQIGQEITVPVAAPVADVDGVLLAGGWITAVPGGSARPARSWRQSGPPDPAWRQIRLRTGYAWLPAAPPGPATHPPIGARPRIPAAPTLPAEAAAPPLPAEAAVPPLPAEAAVRPTPAVLTVSSVSAEAAALAGPVAQEANPGRRTAAGLSLLPPAGTRDTPMWTNGIRERSGGGWESGVGELGDAGPVPAGWLVEVAMGPGGFRVDGRLTAAAALGRLLRAAHPRTAPPVILLVHGDVPAGRAAELLYTGVADALGRPLITSTGRVSRMRSGTLVTTGEFRRWLPRATPAPDSAANTRPRAQSIGPSYPPPPTPATPTPATRTPATPTPATPTPAVRTPAARTPAPIKEPGADQGRKHVEWRSNHVLSSLIDGGGAGAGDAHRERGRAMPVGSDFGGLVALDRWVAVAAPPYAELLSLPASDPASASTAASASTGSSGSATSSASTGASASTMASVGTAASAGTMTSVGTAASAGTMAGAGTAVSAGTASAGTASVGVGAAGGLGSAWAPIRVDGVDLLDDDRLALRRILDGRHDAHARVVNQTLATEPGLRVAALTAPELAAGLIAVRAYCATERESINNVLRGIAAPTADATVLARCVAYGLRRLPTAFGAVFRTATALPVTNYRTGMVLVEPAFLDVNRSPQPDSGREAAGDPVTTAGDPATAAGDPATATGDPATAAGGQVTAAGDLAAEAEFVIWSASARRIGSLAVQASATDPEAGGAPAAVFPAGTVFTVLAVDPPEQDNRWRIYLRELPDGRPIAGGDQVLERLRDALAAGAESTGPDPAASPALTIAPGLDAGGQPFAPRAPEPPAARPGGQRGAGGRGGVARGRRQRGAR